MAVLYIIKMGIKLIYNTGDIKLVVNTNICLDDAVASCRPTLLNLLSRIFPKLDADLSAVMKGNMVTCGLPIIPLFYRLLYELAY